MTAIGRPREFDRDMALDAALVVFWRHGYEGTSLTDLTRAMDINRPALYSAFKSKKDLFYRALDRYCAIDAMHTFEALQEPTARRVTEQYLLRSVEQLTDPQRPAGCLVVRSALTCGPENQDVADHVTRLRKAAEVDLRKRYRRAQREGDLPPGEDPASLARFVCVVRHGLAVMACDGATRAQLRDSIRRAIAGIPAWDASGSDR
jgi:AcrR family transcriptional regulator